MSILIFTIKEGEDSSSSTGGDDNHNIDGREDESYWFEFALRQDKLDRIDVRQTVAMVVLKSRCGLDICGDCL